MTMTPPPASFGVRDEPKPPACLAADTHMTAPMNDTDGNETESISASPRDVLCSKPARAILSFLAFAVLLDGVPRMKRWHLFGVEPLGQAAQPPQSTPTSQLSIGETSLREESQTSDDGRAESEASRVTSAARGPIAAEVH